MRKLLEKLNEVDRLGGGESQTEDNIKIDFKENV